MSVYTMVTLPVGMQSVLAVLMPLLVMDPDSEDEDEEADNLETLSFLFSSLELAGCCADLVVDDVDVADDCDGGCCDCCFTPLSSSSLFQMLFLLLSISRSS